MISKHCKPHQGLSKCMTVTNVLITPMRVQAFMENAMNTNKNLILGFTPGIKCRRNAGRGMRHDPKLNFENHFETQVRKNAGR